MGMYNLEAGCLLLCEGTKVVNQKGIWSRGHASGEKRPHIEEENGNTKEGISIPFRSDDA